MSDKHFAVTTASVVDTLAKGSSVEFNAGDIVRERNRDNAFIDAVILGFSPPNQWGDVSAKLSRPYVYASCVGTTSPTVLMGAETYTVNVKTLVERFEVVGKSFITA